MAELKTDFMLLAVHTDKEFTHWLQSHAEAGWWLSENKGNTFIFTQKPYDGTRVCSYTVTSPSFGVSAEDAFYDELDDLRKSGWDLLTMGRPENLTDNTRHAFLYELPKTDIPHPEVPQTDSETQKTLLKRALNKAISTLAISLIYAAAIVLIVKSGNFPQAADIFRLVFMGAVTILTLLSLFFSFKAIVLYRRAVHNPEMDTSTENYRILDIAVVLNTIMLAVFALYLILDFLI